MFTNKINYDEKSLIDKYLKVGDEGLIIDISDLEDGKGFISGLYKIGIDINNDCSFDNFFEIKLEATIISFNPKRGLYRASGQTLNKESVNFWIFYNKKRNFGIIKRV